jgi:hypothetical protein
MCTHCPDIAESHAGQTAYAGSLLDHHHTILGSCDRHGWTDIYTIATLSAGDSLIRTFCGVQIYDVDRRLETIAFLEPSLGTGFLTSVATRAAIGIKDENFHATLLSVNHCCR